MTHARDGLAVTCVWDSRHYADSVMAGVRATHAYQLTTSGRTASPFYLEPERYLRERRDLPLRSAPVNVDHDVTVGDVAALTDLRSVVGGRAAGHWFAGDALLASGRGRGLWLARQLADVVTVSSVPGLTSVRLHFSHHVMPAPAP